MTTLTETSSTTEKVRFTAGLFLFSGLVGQIILLQIISVHTRFLSAVALTVLLLIAFAGGNLGACWVVFQRKSVLTRIYLGFLISSAGMLFLLLASHGAASLSSLVPGIIISGLGQGMVLQAMTEKNRSTVFFSRWSFCRAGLVLLGAMLSAVICLVIPANNVGMSVSTYAFSVLVDLSLTGAIYAKIIKHDSL